MAVQPKQLYPILPIRSVPDVSKINQIDPTQAVQQVYGPKSIQAKKNAYNRNKKQIETFLADYNDPTELNSYIDALTNRKAVSKEFGDVWGTISTVSGAISVAAAIVEAAAWVVSAILPDASAIGAAGSGAAAGMRAASTAAKVTKAATTAAKIAKAAKTTARVAKTVKRVAAIPAIPAAAHVTYNKGIKPIIAGKPDEAFLNMLMNFGETMDYAANPVKGLILEGPEGFVKGTGLADGGRVNYDYDTGLLLTDMLLEIVTDPINIVQSAGSIVKGVAIKTAIKPTVHLLADSIDHAVGTGMFKSFRSITEKGRTHIFKAISSATEQVSAEWAEATADGFMKQAKKIAIKVKGKVFELLPKAEQKEIIDIAKERLLNEGRSKIQNALIRALQKEFPEASVTEIDLLLKKSGKHIIDGRALQSTRELIDNIKFDTLSSQIIENTSTLVHATNAVDAWMTKGAMLTSSYGLGVDLVRKGFTASQLWASNITIRNLKNAEVLNTVSGLDIKKYEDAKKIWKASYNYAYEITGKKSVRDMAVFQEFVNQQLNRDKQFITLVMQDNNNVIKKAGQLEGQFNTLYQCSFQEYIAHIKKINRIEHGVFDEYVKYLDHTFKVLGDHAFRQGIGETIKTAKSLFNIKELSPDNIVLKLQEAIKNTDNPIKFVEKLYTIKMNDAYVNSVLINDPKIYKILTEINSSERIGALLDKIKSDLNALAPEVSAKIPVAVRIIKEAGAAFANIKELYTEIAGTSFVRVKGISDNDLRKYIIDQIFGLKNKNVIELLAGFDSITMPSLKNGLEMLLYDKGFKFTDYPALEDQIAGVYKRFLEAQHNAGIKEVNAAIVQDFTKSVNDLIDYMPKYANELQELNIASIQIKSTFEFIKNKNLMLLESIFTTKDTIFDVVNPRQLTDAGLALKTVAIKHNLDLFNLPDDWTSSLIKSADQLGSSLNNLIKSLEQYHVVFNTNTRESLQIVYDIFRKQFIDNPEFSAFGSYPALQYLREAESAIEQFAQLAIFNKLVKDPEDSKIFKDLLVKNVGATTYLNIMNPSRLLITDFAWNPMAQSAWVAKAQFNTDTINAINLYRDFDLSIQKGVADFREAQNTLSTHKLDRVKTMLFERHIKTLSKYTDGFAELKTYYDSLFDKDIATQQIENTRKILLNFPELNAKYSVHVNNLESFWRGEKEFIQSAKYERDTENFVDEFTPFHQALQEMNDEIRTEIRAYNSQLYEDFIKNRRKFDKEELAKRKIKFDKEELDRRKIKFDKEELADRKVKFDKEELANRKIKFDKEELNNRKVKFDKEELANRKAKFNEKELKKRLRKFDKEELELRRVGHSDEETLKLYDEILKSRLKKFSINDVPITPEMSKEEYKEAVALYRKQIREYNSLIYRLYNTEVQDTSLFKEYAQEIKQHNDKAYNAYKQELSKHNEDAYYAYISELEEQNKAIQNKYFKQLNAKNNVIFQEYVDELNAQNNMIYQGYTLELKTHNQVIAQDYIDELNAQNDKIFHQYIDEIREYNDKLYQEYTAQRLPYFEGVSPWDPIKKQQELNRLISKATDMNAKGSLYNLFNQTPEEFINELAYRARFITFTGADIADHKLNGMFNKFKNSLPNEKILVHYEDKKDRYWIVLRHSKDLELTQTGRQVYLNGTPIARLQKAKRFDEFKIVDEYMGGKGPKLTELLNHLNDDLYDLTGTALGDSQGEYLTKEMLEDVYIQMPKEVKDALPKLEKWTDKQFFEACRFNESVLGSAASKRGLGLYSTNQIINTRNALQNAIGYLKPKNEYINATFNSLLSISNPNSIWAQFTDEELLKALQLTDEYKLVALINDAKYGIKTREILPTSIEAIKKAKELNAVIIPQQIYKDMYNVVNHRLGSSGFMKLWSRIMYSYKFGFLMDPAAWIKNWIDTNIKSLFALKRDSREYQKRAKNTLADIQDMTKSIKEQQKQALKRAKTEYTALAHTLFEDKDRIEKFIQRRSRDGIIREEEIQKWFADPNNKKRVLTYEAYKELRDDFLSLGVSGNVMADLYTGPGGDLWNTFTQITGNIIEAGNKFENTHRLAQYLYEIDHGENYTTALSKIAKTHFDYSFKTIPEQLVESVFPFATFSLRNASYWVEMLEKHPWIARNYVHLMKPSWDFKDYTPEELACNRSAQTQIRYGHLKIGEFNDKVITFKVNPSIQDALQMFSDPINNIYEKLAAPLGAVRDIAKNEDVNIMNLLPIVGPNVQKIKKTIQTGSPLPGFIGVNKKYNKFKNTKWSNANLSGTDKYTDSTYRTPKYRKNIVYDAYTTKGVTRYRANFYPIVDIAHDIKMRYSVNVYNRIKNRIKTDVYQGIRYRIRLDANKFR